MAISLDILKKKIWQVDGLTLTIGGLLLASVLAYLLFFRK